MDHELRQSDVKAASSLVADSASDALRSELGLSKDSQIKVAIGTCPDCSPPFEWPPNPPKEEPKPKPMEKPKEKKSG